MRGLKDALDDREGLPDAERDTAPELVTLRDTLAIALADGEPVTRAVVLEELDTDTDDVADEQRVAPAVPTAESDCDMVMAALCDAIL